MILPDNARCSAPIHLSYLASAGDRVIAVQPRTLIVAGNGSEVRVVVSHGGPSDAVYLTNGGRSAAGEFVRFTPDLRSGRFEVALADKTPFRLGTEFDVRVRHRDGDSTVRVVPANSRTIGKFDFDEATDGFIEILAEGSQGLVIADAVHFRRVAD